MSLQLTVLHMGDLTNGKYFSEVNTSQGDSELGWG